ncbi:MULTISPECIES: S8 family peptidase [Clostridium]|uniref:S8 family peptidase n=1 Tax=Clostridium TaxID=1485 RepID=UPI0006C37748|nr:MULTISPECIES: S8 family peptidase [Clostridium]MDU1309098.1 S8 family peptidase [Clostridium sp.]MDU1408020.1 S8 family peptidase [Clostridium sp.]CUN52834.1 peptidase S8/S53 subtilisin kexin sedolisin [Clostridium paraputrificum]SQB86953.1 peptidase S8/S53 subtilisin kexin sedolisin [Clostridium paraputrificum]
MKEKKRSCWNYFSEDSPDFIVEYRGNFKEEIDRVDYACGDEITKNLGVVSTAYENIERLKKDVPSIIFIEIRAPYVLQEMAPNDIEGVVEIKKNPYLALRGGGVLVGIVDTGIDYLNNEFIREDGRTRILSIWDQSIQGSSSKDVFIGRVFSEEDINNAINLFKSGGDPYSIVPTKDEVGHGTKVASIIGARGYDEEVEGIAPDCEYVVVKLFESLYYRKMLIENGVEYKPIYNESEILAGIEYLKNYSIKSKKPMVICIPLGTTEGSHDGNNLLSRYITSIGNIRGIVVVAGVGNEGASSTHVSANLASVGDTKEFELKIPKEIKTLSIGAWVKRPNKASVNIISPTGEASRFIQPKIGKKEQVKFIFTNTTLEVYHFAPERFTGHQLVIMYFNSIKAGLWKLQFKGEYVIDGRIDIWLPPKEMLPQGTIFLTPDPYTTLTIPSTARKVVTPSFYNSINDTFVSDSGRGFNSNNLVNPDITAPGINIRTTSVDGKKSTLSGSSAATALTSGVCALLLQWGIIEGNDKTMYSTKVRTYLMYGADRSLNIEYPSREIGFGKLNLLGTFQFISGVYTSTGNRSSNGEKEFYIGSLFIRLP